MISEELCAFQLDELWRRGRVLLPSDHVPFLERKSCAGDGRIASLYDALFLVPLA